MKQRDESRQQQGELLEVPGPTVPIVACCVRCLILLNGRDYEERITFWRTSDLEAAVDKALAEAAQYAKIVGGEAVQFAQSYGMSELPVEDGAEMFSLFRQSDLPPREYVDRYFDTGMEFIGRDGEE